MRIDYSFNPKWKYCGFIPVPFVYGVRHFAASRNCHLSQNLSDRLSHIALGILNMIPLINALVAGLEYTLKGRVRVIELNEEDPFKRGQEFGKKLRKETQQMYACVLKKIREEYEPSQALLSYFRSQASKDLILRNANQKKVEFFALRKTFEQQIPDHIKAEMEGLAEGAKVSYEDVLNVHTFLDIQAGQNGCTVVGTHQLEDKQERLVAANHSFNAPLNQQEYHSQRRQEILEKAPLSSTESYKKALGDVRQDNSVQSIIFNPNKNQIKLATSWSHSPLRNWRSISVFGRKKPSELANQPKVRLARNLDWNWPICGSETIIVSINPGQNKHRFTSVTWPGYLGVLSGMNEKGVALASAQNGSNKQEDGVPVPILFRTILENAATVGEAVKDLKQQKPASSMNVVIAGSDGVASIELDPKKAPCGLALERFVPNGYFSSKGIYSLKRSFVKKLIFQFTY